jgi:hypothetical protein
MPLAQIDSVRRAVTASAVAGTGDCPDPTGNMRQGILGHFHQPGRMLRNERPFRIAEAIAVLGILPGTNDVLVCHIKNILSALAFDLESPFGSPSSEKCPEPRERYRVQYPLANL